jgi:hypothetical protein
MPALFARQCLDLLSNAVDEIRRGPHARPQTVAEQLRHGLVALAVRYEPVWGQPRRIEPELLRLPHHLAVVHFARE